MPKTYLLKTEPDDYSYADLVRDKREPWDGVTNPAACKAMRAIEKGDEAFIYHTGKEKSIVGLAKVVKGPYPDPARPESTAAGEVKYPLVDIAPLREAKTHVDLATIKADERFSAFLLVKQSRLSVMEVPAQLDKLLRKMAGL